MKKIILFLLVSSFLVFTSCNSQKMIVQDDSSEQVTDEELKRAFDDFIEGLQSVPNPQKKPIVDAIEIEEISYLQGTRRRGLTSTNKGNSTGEIKLRGRMYFGERATEFRLVFVDKESTRIGKYKWKFDSVAEVYLPEDQYDTIVELLELDERSLFILAHDSMEYIYADLLVHKKLK